jgi:hypothetical protein
VPPVAVARQPHAVGDVGDEAADGAVERPGPGRAVAVRGRVHACVAPLLLNLWAFHGVCAAQVFVQLGAQLRERDAGTERSEEMGDCPADEGALA